MPAVVVTRATCNAFCSEQRRANAMKWTVETLGVLQSIHSKVERENLVVQRAMIGALVSEEEGVTL